MKKIICILMTVALLFTSAETAYAKKHHENDKRNKHETTYEGNHDTEYGKQEFEIDSWFQIKCGKYQIPIMPITYGMGATVTYDDSKSILTVTKDSNKIEINFSSKTVYVNGVQDTKSGIFTAKSSKKMKTIMKYIAKVLGIWCYFDDDEIIVEVPGLDLPSNITITPVGTTSVANTLNTTTLYLAASAKITAGQATGGRAELYVGSKKVATDASIAASDTTVQFTTSDDTPTNAELQALIPTGGVVTVKLYNSSNNVVTSTTGNPTLIVDYSVPTITGVTSAVYNASANQLKLTVTGAGAVGDKVDVTKITMYDTINAKAYQLTNNSSGTVSSANLIDITIGANDKAMLAGYGSNSMYLSIAPGSLLRDAAGNTSAVYNTAFTVPVANTTVLDLPTKVTVTPVGGTVIANTLNSTNAYMNVTATITAGQATGGRAELYVGTKLVAMDTQIAQTDTTVTFTTSDGTPDNAELRAMVPSGGTVTVKLINTSNNTVTSAVGNPTLTVDYVAPTISSISSAIYNVTGNQIYLVVSGAGATGDMVDVSKVALYDTYLGRYYTLTSSATNGSSGLVISPTSIVINIGSSDKAYLNGFGTQAVTLSIASGSLITDAAGNPSNVLTTGLNCPVTLIK